MKKYLLSLAAMLGFAGMAFAAPVTVTELLAQDVPSEAEAVEVSCYIVGYVEGTSYKENACHFSADGEVMTNILIAASADETDYQKCMPVQLPTKDNVRAELNLVNHPENLGHEVILTGTFEKYFGVKGVKNVSAYEWVGEAPVPGETPDPVDPDPVDPDPVDPDPVDDGTFTALVNNADGWTFDDIALSEGVTYVWSWKTYNGSGYLNASAYVSSAPHAAESYAISPVIDLTDATSAKVSFDHAAKFQTTLRTECTFNVREEGAAEWTVLSIPEWPEAGAWTFANSGNIDLADYAGKKIEVAFKYGSTDEGADTWEIKNLVVTLDKSTGVEAINVLDGVYVEGNNIVAPEGAKVYSINGAAAGLNGLASGLYIVVAGDKAVKVLVK